MHISVAFQTLVFLWAVLLGMLFGTVYDFLKVIRVVLAGRWSTIVCDALFWLFALISGFVFVLTVAQGDGRAYIAIGILGGMSLYRMTFSPLVYGVGVAILQAVQWFLKRFFVVIGKKTQFFLTILQCQTKKICEKAKKILSFSSKKS